MHFDWTINVGNVLSLITLMGLIVNYGGKVVSYLRGITSKVDIMWDQFEQDYPHIARTIKHKYEKV